VSPHEATEDPDAPRFWERRYEAGNTGWDIGQPAPPFVDLMAAAGAPSPGTMIVPGCGRGHDAIFFAQRGFGVTGVDFAHAAIEDAREAARRAGIAVDFVEHDLFTLPPSYDHKFKYVLEHTCFSGIPLARREEYVRLVARLIEPGGLYIALFFTHGKPGGPPFNTTPEDMRALFSPYFTIERLEPAVRSISQRQGEEHLAIMRPLSGERG
jgi:methyl halide transferase